MLSLDMTLAESDEAMNLIGQRRKLECQWRYALHPGYALVNRNGNGAKVEEKRNRHHAFGSKGTVVLEHTSWSDATQIRWALLAHFALPPYNLFLVTTVWRSPGCSDFRKMGAVVWLVLTLFL